MSAWLLAAVLLGTIAAGITAGATVRADPASSEERGLRLLIASKRGRIGLLALSTVLVLGFTTVVAVSRFMAPQPFTVDDALEEYRAGLDAERAQPGGGFGLSNPGNAELAREGLQDADEALGEERVTSDKTAMPDPGRQDAGEVAGEDQAKPTDDGTEGTPKEVQGSETEAKSDAVYPNKEDRAETESEEASGSLKRPSPGVYQYATDGQQLMR